MPVVHSQKPDKGLGLQAYELNSDVMRQSMPQRDPFSDDKQGSYSFRMRDRLCADYLSHFWKFVNVPHRRIVQLRSRCSRARPRIPVTPPGMGRGLTG